MQASISDLEEPKSKKDKKIILREEKLNNERKKKKKRTCRKIGLERIDIQEGIIVEVLLDSRAVDLFISIFFSYFYFYFYSYFQT